MEVDACINAIMSTLLATDTILDMIRDENSFKYTCTLWHNAVKKVGQTETDSAVIWNPITRFPQSFLLKIVHWFKIVELWYHNLNNLKYCRKYMKATNLYFVLLYLLSKSAPIQCYGKFENWVEKNSSTYCTWHLLVEFDCLNIVNYYETPLKSQFLVIFKWGR